ncbi:sugar phosphate isomerase/epimerase family protein [Gaoshiqia sp. Z1-71]|uniref:sugar phosphate isomerase/epimerase family protein n=1 Tax=Gaoshiqia hydrogeniformans TaxID=3290090 RepID=UPI003BF8581B
MKLLKPVYALLLTLVVLFAASCHCGKPDTDEAKPKEAKFTLGVASYTFRKFTIDETLAFMQKLEINNLSLKSFHLRLDASDEEIAQMVQKCKDAGINLYAGGVIYMTSEDEVDQAFEYASKTGMKMIVGVPNHELLPYVENKVKAYDIKLAIHNHGPGDKLYPSAESAYLLIKEMDPRMGLCIDIGHTKRIDRDPSQDVKDFYDRVFDIHVKDVTRADHDGSTCEIGRGVIDLKTFLSDLIELEYDGIVAFEYEKDGDNPFAGFAESVGYVRGMLEALK